MRANYIFENEYEELELLILKFMEVEENEDQRKKTILEATHKPIDQAFSKNICIMTYNS